MGTRLLPAAIRKNFEIHEYKHACSILRNDFPVEWSDIITVLGEFRFKKSWIDTGGGSKSKVARAIDEGFVGRGWVEKDFSTQVVVDGNVMDSPTHKIDCYKNRIALEIEWNNKDPFFDRDLNNFRLLFDLGAISVGVIVTRCDDLQTIFDAIGRGASFGAATTHMSKLLPKLVGGGGGGCPILVFGIKSALYVGDE